MISLTVEKYCHECPDFVPVATPYISDGRVIMNVVSCENYNKCKRIAEHIRMQEYITNSRN